MGLGGTSRGPEPGPMLGIFILKWLLIVLVFSQQFFVAWPDKDYTCFSTYVFKRITNSIQQ